MITAEPFDYHRFVRVLDAYEVEMCITSGGVFEALLPMMAADLRDFMRWVPESLVAHVHNGMWLVIESKQVMLGGGKVEPVAPEILASIERYLSRNNVLLPGASIRDVVRHRFGGLHAVSRGERERLERFWRDHTRKEI